MRAINFLFIITILNYFNDSSIEPQNIIWIKEIKLKWSDFKGAPKENTVLAAVSSVGISYKEISHSIDKYFFEVNAEFEKNKSWVWVKKASDSILVHEQGHFDLAEIYARKMRQGLISNQFQFTRKNIIQEIHKVLDLYADSLSIMHQNYDLAFSKNYDKQKEWNLYIEKELQFLEKYKYRFVNVYLKKEENK